MASRRRKRVALAAASALLAIATLGACESEGVSGVPVGSPSTASGTETAARGLLRARPGTPAKPTDATGRIPLGLAQGRDGFLYVPRGSSAATEMPLVVFFHGAGGAADQADAILPIAERDHFLVLSIDSRESTWDLVDGEPGPDVTFVDRALAWTFARRAVDPARITACGFSDGASYALSLGLANGDLFESIVAFSPGFAAPPQAHGRPRVFIGHGIADAVLAIDRCGRRIARDLRSSGYDVTYLEFAGPHTMAPEIVRRAFEWLVRGGPSA